VFMERFGKMTLKIKNLSPEVALHHLVITLKPGPFSGSLCKNPAASLEELRRRIAKYMVLEELKDFRKQIKDEMSQKLMMIIELIEVNLQGQTKGLKIYSKTLDLNDTRL